VSGYAERNGLISWRAVEDKARRVMDLMGVWIDVDRTVSSLAIAERSLVAIARGLAVDARLLILDEPTAALPAADVHRLFEVVRRLRDDGISVVHVTHRLDEVFAIGDRVTVLRDGCKAGTVRVSETTPADLVMMIVGRRLSDIFPTSQSRAGSPVLRVSDVETSRVGPVSLTLRSGEILGLVGLRGAGHDSLGRAIFGDVPLLGGRIHVRDIDVGKPRPLDMMHRGIGFVSSKRGEEALAETLSALENLFPRPAMGRASDSAFIHLRAETRDAREVMGRFAVRPPDPTLAASLFSGGNQQKIVLARWMELGSEILILEEPTIGVDIGAKAEIYNLLAARVAAGSAVIVVSSDFEEVAGICHRALVFDRGKIVAELPRGELSQSSITRLASASTALQ
jgi:ribose transport system ATP-binding protein